MKNEIEFKGSQLETEIRNTHCETKLKKVQGFVKNGFDNRHGSLFWKDALEFINLKLKVN